MFAQKFSRNKVELHVRCLSLSLPYSPLPPLCLSLVYEFSNSVCLCAQENGGKTRSNCGGKLQTFFFPLLFCILYASA